MRMLVPVSADPRAPLPRANPVAKLAAALILLIALFASRDAVTATLILGVLLALVPASGLRPGALLARSWLIVALALSIAVLNTLLAPVQQGGTVLEIGPARIGSESLLAGISLGLRLLAIGLAGILATATTQPVDLADALVQQLRVSPRFAIGVLGAFRLLPTLARDWQTASLARRARGVDAGRTPVSAARYVGGLVLGLLVTAIRRGTRLSLAMESRGFGSRPCRTASRPQRMRPGDWGWIAGAAALAVGAVWISLALGTWQPLLG